jgi:phosphoribosylaminoimidazole-succinocarboxamide synthase
MKKYLNNLTNKLGGYLMEKREQLCEGKAKKVFKTEDENFYIVSYKDDATAFNGIKKGTISGKGVVNNRMSNYLMKLMEEKGIPTHYVQELNDRETVVKKVSIVPLEVIVRNIAAGSFSKRLGVKEGTPLKTTVLEYCYKDDSLGDVMVNDYHILAMGYATKEELDTIADITFKVNDFLKDFFAKVNVELVDFKIEFGKTPDGKIILADEISPDTCRFWDATTHEKLDKDRFRRDLGGVEDAYAEMMKRVFGE